MATNPSPSRISPAMWELWEGFRAVEKKAKLGGVFAPKPGYHNARENLGSKDYSVGQVAGDSAGAAKWASAIDLTLPPAEMKKYSKRLDDAMKTRDPRLFLDDEPILREYIGTLDGETVRCHVLVGGKRLGVGADSGPDFGRDSSHLWHIHLSVIRKFAADAVALRQILSILKGDRKQDELPVDGILGTATITRWQQAMGTTADGRISEPSKLVKAVQKHLNAKVRAGLVVDGRGIAQNGKSTNTIRALQRYLGVNVTGALTGGSSSPTIVALQKKLNKGSF
jgi:hypothetical protein